MTQTKQPKAGSKSSSHTPGPWEVRKVKDVTEVVGYLLPNAPQLIFDPCRMDEANARLIAAAPEMYELLSHITNHDPLLPCGFCINEARRIKAEIDGE